MDKIYVAFHLMIMEKEEKIVELSKIKTKI